MSPVASATPTTRLPLLELFEKEFADAACLSVFVQDQDNLDHKAHYQVVNSRQGFVVRGLKAEAPPAASPMTEKQAEAIAAPVVAATAPALAVLATRPPSPKKATELERMARERLETKARWDQVVSDAQSVCASKGWAWNPASDAFEILTLKLYGARLEIDGIPHDERGPRKERIHDLFIKLDGGEKHVVGEEYRKSDGIISGRWLEDPGFDEKDKGTIALLAGYINPPAGMEERLKFSRNPLFRGVRTIFGDGVRSGLPLV